MTQSVMCNDEIVRHKFSGLRQIAKNLPGKYAPSIGISSS
jgi:hypothetical protein